MGVRWTIPTAAEVEALAGDVREADRVGLRASHGREDVAGWVLAHGGPSWLCEAPGGPVGLVGVRPYRAGVGIVWSFTTPLAAAHGFPYTRGARRMLDHAMGCGLWRRLEAWCLRGDGRNERWVRALGFRFEGVMRATGLGGEDVALYGRTV